MRWKRKKTVETVRLERPQLVPIMLQGIDSVFMLVTPEIARQWLKHNVKNRRMIEDTANALARDMKAGNWLPTHQGVAFNDKNELIDGQHRLEAVIRSNMPVVMMVTIGLPEHPEGKNIQTMDVVDRGTSRSVANVLQLQRGIKNSGSVAKTATVIGNLCYRGRLRKATVPQVVGIVEIFLEHINWIVDRQAGRDMPQLRTANVMGAFAFAHAVHPQDTEEFYRDFLCGNGSDQAEQARTFLMGQEAFKISAGGSANRVVLAEVLLQAIFNFIHDRDVKLRHGMEGAEYFKSKQPEITAKITTLFELETYHRGTGENELPPPTNREKQWAEFRSGLNIKTDEDDPIEARR